MPRSLETTLICRESAWPTVRHWLVERLKGIAADLQNVPRYALRTLISAALVCGLLSLWGLRGDGMIPAMHSLSGLDPYRISSDQCIADKTDKETRWNGLSPALAILDQVNPTVATWLREKHEKGLVVFGEDGRTKYDNGAALAKYDAFTDQIALSPELFCENDGTIAVTLCHEYRHSRQNLGKSCQYILSFLFVRGGNLAIIENDAVIYEQQAQSAIFGNGRSSEKELAAWEAAVRRKSEHDNRSNAARTSTAVVASQLP